MATTTNVSVDDLITKTVANELTSAAGLPDELRAASLSERANSYRQDAATIAGLGIDDEGIYLAIATRLEGAAAYMQVTR